MSSASNKITNFFLLLFVGLQVIASAFTNLLAQSQPALPDTLIQAPLDTTLLAWSEASAYQIARLRVMRWLIKQQAQAGSDLVQNVTELVREAESFAKEEDFVTAQVLLETALDFISSDTKTGAITQAASAQRTALPNSFSKTPWHWQREALAGVDLSRLEYELGNDEFDLLYVDPHFAGRSVQDNANPFAGARLNLSRSGDELWDFHAFSLLKSSREYYTGALELTAQSALHQETQWRAENRFEATSYRDTSGLRYWQNTSMLRGGVKLGQHVKVEVEEEFRVRQYRSEREFSPNYLHNEVGLSALYAAGYSTRVQGRYEYGVRTHPRFPQDDYLEHRFEASVTQHSFENSAIFVQNIWRRRLYPLGIADSTFQNTYQEEFLRADLTIGFTARTALRLEGDLTLRKYETASVYTPDFLSAKINPKLQWKIWSDWQASVGYIFLLQVNSTKQEAAASNPSLTFVNGFYEDYYANGFTLGLDLFSTSGFLVSASHVFEARTYPDSPMSTGTWFNPNPNRNNNSFLLFLSWQVNPRWQLSTIANFDSQISRAEYSENLRNTIFSMELGYTF